MTQIAFNGQQEGEKILYELHPHAFAKYLTIGKIIILAIFFYFILNLISTVVPLSSTPLSLTGLILAGVIIVAGIWWNMMVYNRSITYITDRRIVRFWQVSPFFRAKRALFWNEALKAKGYTGNIIWRAFNIGSVQVEPHLSEHEDVVVHDVFMFEDVANYIDKILYTFKNKPQEVDQIKPFVLKPRGQRFV